MGVTEWVASRGVPSDISTTTYSYRMAVFRRFLRATLYALHTPEHSTLSQLVPGTNWEKPFSQARQETDATGFKRSVADQLMKELPEPVDQLLLSLRQPVTYHDDPAMLFSSVYETLAPQAARRDLGQFATPKFVSSLMASWAVQDGTDQILDPGIGSGALAAQALDRKLKLGSTVSLNDITGIDIDEVAIAMAAVTLKIIDGAGGSNLQHGDFIEYSPRTFTRSDVEIDQYDGVIANPPYSRHQALDTKLKDNLKQVVSQESGHEFSQRTPLYGYFLAHATQFINVGGRIAVIVPSKFLDTKFGRDLKQYLINEFLIHGIIQFDDGIDVFEGVRTRPCILFLEKGAANENHKTRFARLSSWSGEVDAETLLEDSIDELSDVTESTIIKQSLLSPTERWSYYLNETDVRDLPELTNFEEIATVRRGIATGDNSYFCLTQEEVEEYGIPKEYREKIIRSMHGNNYVNLTENNWEDWRDDNQAVWLLYCYDESSEIIKKNEITDTATLSYLKMGESSETMDRYLVSNRDPWYRVESQEPAPILGKYMNRTGFLFARNDADLRTLNNVHAITLDINQDGTDPEVRDALLAYLNSTVMERILTLHSHDYNGLQKLEISQLNSAPVIDSRRLDEKKRSKLARLFNDLCVARQRGDDGSEIIRTIDEELEPVLALKDEEK
ncbi:type i restriction-modification system methyltransferase subunit [Halorubrum distributum JCM 13916]|uniref:Type i restriction-modification system methyltransferase subunit n=1 Tax=Halorubrum distributum JCM 13916 TaxID=1230455 RepID=M0PJX5_9EURY|nr:type i restriction-modification system methyltransferase subunit [Halorubrum arcis JCM 13916]